MTNIDGPNETSSVHRTLSNSTSRNIEFLRMFLVLGIMCIHYGRLPGHESHPFQGYFGQENFIAVFVTSFIVYLALCGVPTLSAISGFLFFRNASFSTPPPFRARLNRRFRSLFVPLLIWNSTVLFAALVLLSFRPNPGLQTMLDFDPSIAAWFDYIDAVIGVTRHPIVYPMWFVRDLFLTALLTPLWWFLARKVWWLGAMILGGSWFFDHNLWVFFRTDIPFFFYLGMLVALNNWNVALPKKTAIGLLAAYMALVALRVVVPYFIAEESRYWLDFATSLLRLLGVLALWTSVPLFLNARWVNTVIHWSPLAFFTHSGHFPLIALLNYFVLAKLLPHSNDAFLLLHFFLTVASTLVILFVGASILRRFAPGLFRILSGSRQWPEESGQPVTTIDGVLLQRGREG